jgi:hypothetical protein
MKSTAGDFEIRSTKPISRTLPKMAFVALLDGNYGHPLRYWN